MIQAKLILHLFENGTLDGNTSTAKFHLHMHIHHVEI